MVPSQHAAAAVITLAAATVPEFATAQAQVAGGPLVDVPARVPVH